MVFQQRQQSQRLLLDHAATELESLRSLDDVRSSKTAKPITFRNKPYNDIGVRFPSACLQLLITLPGNRHCVDCGAMNPDWASITYGTLLCLQCSGIHRSYGVQVSYVRSLQYDTWNHKQILSMLEGGNNQLRTFFHRHHLLNNGSSPNNHIAPIKNCKSLQQLYNQRYHTKAALFYKVNLVKHVEEIAVNGSYKGREYNRQYHNHNKSANSCRSVSPITVVDKRLGSQSIDPTEVTGTKRIC